MEIIKNPLNNDEYQLKDLTGKTHLQDKNIRVLARDVADRIDANYYSDVLHIKSTVMPVEQQKVFWKAYYTHISDLQVRKHYYF